MRLRLFEDIEARLAFVRIVDDNIIYHRPKQDDDTPPPGEPAINHFGLWNETTTQLTQSRPFNPPAVFVEFFPIVWSPLSRKTIHGDMTVRFHIVTATLAQTDTPYREGALSRFRLIRALKLAFTDFAGEADSAGRSYSTWQPLESETDHNHDQICEDLESWRTHCIDASATLDDGHVFVTANLTLGEAVYPV